MNILGVQIITILFAVFMLYVTFLHWKRKDLSTVELLFWGLLWGTFIVLVLFPHILQNVTQILFFARIMDLLMIAAFMILSFLGFQNYVSNKKMEKEIENLVRKEALHEIPKFKK